MGCAILASSGVCHAKSPTSAPEATASVSATRSAEPGWGNITLGLEHLIALSAYRQGVSMTVLDVLATPRLMFDVGTPLGITLGGGLAYGVAGGEGRRTPEQHMSAFIRAGADWRLDETLHVWPRLGAHLGYSTALEHAGITLNAVVIELPLAVEVGPQLTFLLGPAFKLGRTRAATAVDVSLGLALFL